MNNSFSLKIKNYKCFLNDEQGFDKILPINVVIGKNNSGKSSLIDIIEKAFNGNKNYGKHQSAKLTTKLCLSEDYLLEVAKEFANQNSRPQKYEQYRNQVIQFVGTRLNEEIIFDLSSEKVITDIPNFETSSYPNAFNRAAKKYFTGRIFKKIDSERDIKAEWSQTDEKIELNPNGDGATNIIRKIVYHSSYNTNIIKRDLLNELNTIVNPDIYIKDILPQEISDINNSNSSQKYELFFLTEPNEEYIALSQMGSGFKTILLVLLNLIVVPKIERFNIESYIFCFEELENNLHPSLQKRLLNYIADYVKKNKCLFFLTTHSNVAIDLFATEPSAQIIHIQQHNGGSLCTTLENATNGRSLLNDLGYKASDLLLSNGIIWVEGPSDVLYLELFLSLYFENKGLDSKKINYTIQPLSTAIWKHVGFSDFDWNKVHDNIQNQLISLTKINHNHLIVLDKDNDYENIPPNNWNEFKNQIGKNKSKLIYESMLYHNYSFDDLSSNYGDTSDGRLLFWINDGTIETYLKDFLDLKGKEFAKYFEKNKTGKYIEKKRKGDDSAKSKVELALEISSFTFANDLLFKDFAPVDSNLEKKIISLIQTISSWN